MFQSEDISSTKLPRTFVSSGPMLKLGAFTPQCGGPESGFTAQYTTIRYDKTGELTLIWITANMHFDTNLESYKKAVYQICLKNFLGFYISGMVLGVPAVYSDIHPRSTAYLLTPYTTISKVSCLSFRYFAQTSLITSLISPEEHRILADFMATGYDFHRTFVDLPVGSYRLVWETLHAIVPQTSGVEKEFLVAIDDVIIFDGPCYTKRKLLLVFNKCVDAHYPYAKTRLPLIPPLLAWELYMLNGISHLVIIW